MSGGGLARMTRAVCAVVVVAPAMVVCALAAPRPNADDGGGAVGDLGLTTRDVRRLVSHGPWPLATPHDPSNAVSGNAAAIALGHRLFFDRRLSSNAAIACATCHVPERGWSDGRARAAGLAAVDRNTPTIVDAALHRWFSWDGSADSLWAQSLKPIVDPREMGASGAHVARLVANDATLACLHANAFGPDASDAAAQSGALARVVAPPSLDSDRALVHAGKALAAFIETVRSARTPFDDFRDALARGDRDAAARYPAPALRGAKLFVGSDCGVCHTGPAFTNGEFHDVGVPYALGGGRVDAGRYEGVKRLRADRFNLLGAWSDDPLRESAVKTRHVEATHASFGQFRTPSLRNLVHTAPYMHDGRYATLRDVVRHYSELDMERIHTHGEQLLRPLKLSPPEVDDLVAFLESLSEPVAARVPPPPSLRRCAR